MSNIRVLASPALDKSAALEVLDDLRNRIEDGTIVAFACVGISPDDGTSEWLGNVGKKTHLQFVGACAGLLHAITNEATE